MAKRIYLVEGPGGKKRLVNATTAGTAINHCAKADYQAKIPTQSELLATAKAGVEVEEAGENGGA